MVAEQRPFITRREYIELEKQAEYKNEYINGQIYAISGGSMNHARIAAGSMQSLTFNYVANHTSHLIATSALMS